MNEKAEYARDVKKKTVRFVDYARSSALPSPRRVRRSRAATDTVVAADALRAGERKCVLTTAAHVVVVSGHGGGICFGRSTTRRCRCLADERTDRPGFVRYRLLRRMALPF